MDSPAPSERAVAQAGRSPPTRGALVGACLCLAIGCEPAPTGNPFNTVRVGRAALAVEQGPDGSLILASANILNEGQVARADGASVTTLLSHSADALRIAQGFLYFTRRYDGPPRGVVGRVALAGGEEEWFPAKGGVSGLATDDEYVYWLEARWQGGTPEGIRRMPHAGGPPEVLQEVAFRGQLEVDETHLYWITQEGMARVSKQGGDVETILEPDDWMPYVDGMPSGFALTDRHVFFASGAGFGGARAALLRMTKDGRDMTLLAEQEDGAYYMVMTDSSHVYWVRGQTNDAVAYPGFQDIVRMPLPAGLQEVIARQQNGVTDLLRTGEGLYWTCRNERFLNFAALK